MIRNSILMVAVAAAAATLFAQDTETKPAKKILKQAWEPGDKGKVTYKADLKGKTSSSWTGQSWPFTGTTGSADVEIEVVKGGKFSSGGKTESISPETLDTSFLLPGKEAKAKLAWAPDAAKFTAFLKKFSGGDVGALSCSKVECKASDVGDDRVEIEVSAQVASKFDGGQAKRNFDVKMAGKMVFDLKKNKVTELKLEAKAFKIQAKWDQWDTEGEGSEFTISYTFAE